MQGLILQLTRAGFLLLLVLFVLAVLRVLRTDVYAESGLRAQRRERAGARSLGVLGLGRTARTLVVTQGALAGTRIALDTAPILIGRADDSTLVLTDDYASNRHARISPRGSDWYLEDLGSTNGTFLDRDKVTTAVRVPLRTPVRVGKTVIELRP
ncbi:FHA domain-containing protein FhaB/FipA [Lolliginicoccus suaedae]|uniref:FHA domain-containing protein FhaB/FipA n=1 Tax=Lolliginicoccus suaedae TaxID=2605429 RepID=UPI0011ED5CE8|nr:FHA domain-containing protein [Lolliginicoccus suaedae]